jgi:hypothetical protein
LRRPGLAWAVFVWIRTLQFACVVLCGCAVSDLMVSTKVVKASVGKVTVALAGAFESRMDTWVGDFAISTHSLPSPGPE